MFNRNNFEIAGEKVKPGTRKKIRLQVSESYVTGPTHIPLTVIHGKKPGPSLLVTAAVHGDELNGIEIVRRLTYEYSFEDLRGTLILVPVVNIYGFQNRSRYLPEDKDLNRCFPGCSNGWADQRYAHIIFNELICKSNYIIDLHTAALGRNNLPHVRGDLSNQEIRRMALAFGTTVIMDNEGLEGSLRESAASIDVPAIILEAGQTGSFEKKHASFGVLGVLNVMSELGMNNEELRENPYRIIVKSANWIRADKGGILSINKRPGRIVAKNKEIATNSNPFGEEVESIRAPFNGIVLGIATSPTVVPGQSVCHFFKLEEPIKNVRAKLFELYGKKWITV